MNGTGELTLWLPNGLDLKPRMERAGLGGSTVYAEWLVSEVVRRSVFGKVPRGEYVPLPVAAIQAGIPVRLVAKVKRAVGDVVENDGVYWWDAAAVGEGKCLGYRLAAGVSREFVPVSRQASELARKLTADDARKMAKQDADLGTRPEFYRTLRRHMDSVRLAEVPLSKPHPVLDYLTGNRRRWFTVCAQGRVHHPVASCPKAFRPHLRFGDSTEPLAILDVATSQPALLGLAVRERCASAGLVPPDVDRFVGDCTHGDLYDTLADEVWRSFGSAISRDAAKEHWMMTAYGKAERFDRLLVGRAMRYRYPAFFDIICRDAAANRLGHLARLMQMAESGVMIGGVAADFVRNHSRIPFVTIHDAVLAPISAMTLISDLTQHHFRQRFGDSPRLKITSLSR